MVGNLRDDDWGVVHAPADNTQATISKAAATDQTHYCTSITVTLEGTEDAAATTFNLRDSTTGAGNILWTAKLNVGFATNTDSRSLVVSNLNIRGVAGQAMTLESAAAPAAAQSATVAMTGYTAHRKT